MVHPLNNLPGSCRSRRRAAGAHDTAVVSGAV